MWRIKPDFELLFFYTRNVPALFLSEHFIIGGLHVGLVDVKNLSKSYGEFQAVNDFLLVLNRVKFLDF